MLDSSSLCGSCSAVTGLVAGFPHDPWDHKVYGGRILCTPLKSPAGLLTSQLVLLQVVKQHLWNLKPAGHRDFTVHVLIESSILNVKMNMSICQILVL